MTVANKKNSDQDDRWAQQGKKNPNQDYRWAEVGKKNPNQDDRWAELGINNTIKSIKPLITRYPLTEKNRTAPPVPAMFYNLVEKFN